MPIVPMIHYKLQVLVMLRNLYIKYFITIYNSCKIIIYNKLFKFYRCKTLHVSHCRFVCTLFIAYKSSIIETSSTY